MDDSDDFFGSFFNMVTVDMCTSPSPLKLPDSVNPSAPHFITNDKLLTRHCVLYEKGGLQAAQCSI